MERILERELLEYRSFSEQRRAATDAKIKEITSGQWAQGLMHSGQLNSRIAAEKETLCRDLITERIRLRRHYGTFDLSLLTDEQLDPLETELTGSVKYSNAAIKERFKREANNAGITSLQGVEEDVIDVDTLTGMVRREIKKIKLDRDLGILKPNIIRDLPAEPQPVFNNVFMGSVGNVAQNSRQNKTVNLLKPMDESQRDQRQKIWDFLTPASFINAAKEMHPAFSYAIAVAGILAIIVTFVRFGVGFATLVFGAIAMISLMVLFLVFAQASKLAKSTLKLPAQVLVWAFLILNLLIASGLVLSTFINWPLHFRDWIEAKLEQPLEDRPLESLPK